MMITINMMMNTWTLLGKEEGERQEAAEGRPAYLGHRHHVTGEDRGDDDDEDDDGPLVLKSRLVGSMLVHIVSQFC